MMSRTTGRHINKIEHIQQSIQDILTTPIGSRIMRREYGSLLPQLIDAPTNATTLLQLKVAAATAIMQWEDRIKINNIHINHVGNGKAIIGLETTASDNTPQSFDIPVHFGGAL